MSVDLRSRTSEDIVAVDAATFFDQTLPALMEILPHLPGAGALELSPRPLAIEVGGQAWTLRLDGSRCRRSARHRPCRGDLGPRRRRSDRSRPRRAHADGLLHRGRPRAPRRPLGGHPRLVGGAAVAARRAAGARQRRRPGARAPHVPADRRRRRPRPLPARCRLPPRRRGVHPGGRDGRHQRRTWTPLRRPTHPTTATRGGPRPRNGENRLVAHAAVPGAFPQQPPRSWPTARLARIRRGSPAMATSCLPTCARAT